MDLKAFLRWSREMTSYKQKSQKKDLGGIFVKTYKTLLSNTVHIKLDNSIVASPVALVVKNLPANAGGIKRCGFNP